MKQLRQLYKPTLVDSLLCSLYGWGNTRVWLLSHYVLAIVMATLLQAQNAISGTSSPHIRFCSAQLDHVLISSQ